MTSEERDQIRAMTSRPPGSLWGYWPFIFPVLLVVIGIAVQIALLRYLESRFGSFDILIKHGTKTELLWDSQLVKEAVLTVSLSITVTFGLLAFLAYRSHKQAVLLKAAAQEIGVENGQQRSAANRSQPVSPETNRTSSAAGSGG
jgi:hypothetical protein